MTRRMKRNLPLLKVKLTKLNLKRTNPKKRKTSLKSLGTRAVSALRLVA
jgi:hypothetical protein